MKAIMFAAALVMGSATSLTALPTAVSAQPTGETITVKVKGLFCDLCRTKMEKSFGKIKGVNSVSVNLDTGIVRLVMAPGKTLGDDRIKKIISQTGYTSITITRA